MIDASPDAITVWDAQASAFFQCVRRSTARRQRNGWWIGDGDTCAPR